MNKINVKWVIGMFMFQLVTNVLFILAIKGSYPECDYITTFSSIGAVFLALSVVLLISDEESK